MRRYNLKQMLAEVEREQVSARPARVKMDRERIRELAAEKRARRKEARER